MPDNKTQPAKSVELLIRENKYTVNFPKTGEFIDIQALKNKIASDNYHLLSGSVDIDSGYAMLLCDMIATFNVLIPDLKADLNITSILGLSMIESRELLDVYLKVWVPFYKAWMNVLSSAPVAAETATEEEVKNAV